MCTKLGSRLWSEDVRARFNPLCIRLRPWLMIEMAEASTPRRASPNLLVRGLNWGRRKAARAVVKAANGQRNASRWSRAASLYELGVRLVPARQDLLIQAGNCRKESGMIDRAVSLYERVDHSAHRAEAAFQKGDALAKAGAGGLAIDALETALALGHPRAEHRLDEVGHLGLLGSRTPDDEPLPEFDQSLSSSLLLNRLTSGNGGARRLLGTLDRRHHRKTESASALLDEHIAFMQVGWLRVQHNGRSEPLLTGVVAVRAKLRTRIMLERVELLDSSGVLASTRPVLVDEETHGRRLYSVNIWLDTAVLRPGRRAFKLAAFDAGGVRLTARTIAHVVPRPGELGLTASDAFVSSAPAPARGDAAEEVASRPAMVRSAQRGLLSRPPQSIAVMRVDQLGDVSASLAAMAALRRLFPEARITAIVAPMVVQVVEAAGLFDEILPLSLQYDPSTEQRFLDADEAAQFAERCAKVRFDLAIDLCVGDETRPLLKMLQAGCLVGFNPRSFNYLDFGIDVISRDKVNRLANVSHAASVMMLIEALKVALTPAQPATLRLVNPTGALSSRGLTPNAYIVVHTGARHPINQWPMDKYVDLATRLTTDTGRPVVFFADQALTPDQSARLAAADVIVIIERVPVDDFDALISNCAVLVGNDSGPKHLAAARGVETVSLHVNRLNWSEWGQDGRGVILSKRVPCCGCGLNDDKMCAKEVLCLTAISVDEAQAAVLNRWRAARRSAEPTGQERQLKQ